MFVHECISPLEDYLRRRVTMRRVMQLVLDDFEELDGFRALRVVVHAGGVEVQHLAVKHLLRGADVPYAVKALLSKVKQPMAAHAGKKDVRSVNR